MTMHPSYRRRFGRNERGGASLEFVVVALGLFTMLFTMVEAGVLMMRSVMLERGLDLAVRDVRLGLIAEDDHARFKTRVCDGAFLIGDCENSITVEMRAFLDVARFLDEGDAFVGGGAALTRPECRDRREEDVPPPSTFDVGGPGSIMLVRSCLVVDPFFPGLGLGASLIENSDAADGGYAIFKTAAFMREPK